jgi:CyaY protein
MTSAEYEQLTDAILNTIDEMVEKLDVDIESELNGNILTLIFPNRSKIIINKQPSLQEIWVAAKAGGFHFKFAPDRQQWLTANGEELSMLLSKVCSEHAATPVELTL